MLGITRGRLLAAAVALSGATASAQEFGPPAVAYGPVVGCPFGNCAAANHGTYGPALFACNPKGHGKMPGPNEPGCIGRSSYPLSDWHYIRQFCGPTLIPGTCYGHFQTKWRRWEEHCSDGSCAGGAVGVPLPEVSVPLAPPQTLPTTPTPPSGPPMPDPKPVVPPKGDVPKVDPVAPPKIPLGPKEGGLTPSTLPVIPVVPPPGGTEPGKISMTEATQPAPTPDVVRPQPEAPVVVPPERK
jgi:hypothetical protein